MRNNPKSTGIVGLVDELLWLERTGDDLFEIECQKMIVERRDFLVDQCKHPIIPPLFAPPFERVVIGDNNPLKPRLLGGIGDVGDVTTSIRIMRMDV